MNAKRGVLFVGGAALLAAWLAAAADQDRQAPDAPAPHEVSALDRAEHLARDIQSQAARLRARVAAAPEPAGSGRNPFIFHVRPAAPRSAPRVSAGSADEMLPALSIPEPPPLSLSGIAEDEGAEGVRIRTAVLSGLGDVFFAKAGDTILERYEVVAVGADAVELRDLTSGRTIRLGLR
jgi:hypothetical protein